MKHYLFLLVLIIGSVQGKAQKLDSLFFNLYTDSLKKGTYNYINVDGKYSDGRYLPLTEKQIAFTSSAGKFQGNSLYIDSNFSEEKVNIKAALKSDPAVFREITIYIKKHEAIERLKTLEEVLDKPRRKSAKNL